MSSALCSSQHSNNHSSAMSTKTYHSRGECKTTLGGPCLADKALYIFIAPWSSPRLLQCWLPSLSLTSKLCICFILIFSHLVITPSHAEKVIAIVITRGAKL